MIERMHIAIFLYGNTMKDGDVNCDLLGSLGEAIEGLIFKDVFIHPFKVDICILSAYVPDYIDYKKLKDHLKDILKRNNFDFKAP